MRGIPMEDNQYSGAGLDELKKYGVRLASFIYENQGHGPMVKRRQTSQSEAGTLAIFLTRWGGRRTPRCGFPLHIRKEPKR